MVRGLGGPEEGVNARAPGEPEEGVHVHGGLRKESTLWVCVRKESTCAGGLR